MAKDIKELFTPRTPPYPHQWEALQASYTKRAFALLLDPGLGKTKIVLDTAVLWYERTHINAMLVLAPNDVHAQWVEEQVPLHWPAKHRLRTAIWRGHSTRCVRECRELAAKAKPGTFALMVMNHEALATAKGRTVATQFLRTHRALLVLDESHEFANPAAARTKAACRLAPLAFGRRILTGTLTDGTPFDYYAQYKFLSPAIIGQDSYLTFKREYAQWSKDVVTVRGRDGKAKVDAQGRRVLREYPVLEGYRNIEQLTALVAPYTFSKRKEDCEGLPERTAAVVPTHLSKEQRGIYGALLEDGVALLERAARGNLKAVDFAELDDPEYQAALARLQDPRQRVTYAIKLTLTLRLQQCVAGIVREDAGEVHAIHGKLLELPRLADTLRLLRQVLQRPGAKAIVWAHYRPVIERLLVPAAQQAGMPVVAVHGGVTGEERAGILRRFKDPKDTTARLLIAHPRTLGTGQNFAVAHDAVYYTRSFSRIQRKQSEDRVHRLGQRGTVTIWDVVATDAPTDQKELETLRGKEDMARELETFTARDLREALACSF